MEEYTLPLPLITTLSQVFWDGCRDNKLLYQHCMDCRGVIFFPKYLCPNCMGHKLEWLESKGKGVIDTFTVTYEGAPPAFMGVTPYCVAIIRMDEGYRMMSNIIDCDFDELECEMPVEVVFQTVTEEITLPKFRPVKQA